MRNCLSLWSEKMAGERKGESEEIHPNKDTRHERKQHSCPGKWKFRVPHQKAPYSCHRDTPGLTKPWRQQWATSPWHPVVLAGIRFTASLPSNLGTVSDGGNLRKSPGRMIPSQGLEPPHLHVIEAAPIPRSQVQLDKVKIILHHAYSSFWTHYGHTYRHTYRNSSSSWTLF